MKKATHRVLRFVPLALLGAGTFFGVRSLVEDPVVGTILALVVIYFSAKELW